jgi:hypothetical protein
VAADVGQYPGRRIHQGSVKSRGALRKGPPLRVLRGEKMADFDARYEASEVVDQWCGIVVDGSTALDLARNNPDKALELLRAHWPETEYSEPELKEIARQISRLA